jgi:DNA repair protein RecO (recombination protein O)
LEFTIHAIVLRRRDQGESDRKLTVLSQERGVLDVIAKGARKSGSRLGGASEPLSVSVFQVASGKKQAFVTQAQPVMSFPGFRSDYERLSFALALSEIASAILPHDAQASEEFTFLLKAFKYLELHEKPRVAFVWAQLQLLSLGGFQPTFEQCAVSGEPIKETPCWLSPEAGGYLSPAEAWAFTDRFQVPAEVLYVLSACLPLEAPPAGLKFTGEAMRALLPFWRRYAERNSLPALETAVNG